jgi:hypothetical protein
VCDYYFINYFIIHFICNLLPNLPNYAVRRTFKMQIGRWDAMVEGAIFFWTLYSVHSSFHDA